MGLELELSELAVIRPIQTAVSSAGSATPARPGSEEGKDAADTGCVTPTAAVSPSPLQGGLDVDTGCLTPTAVSPLPRQGGGVDVEDTTGCVTPRATRSFVPLQVGDFEDNWGCVTPANPIQRRGGVVLDIVYATPTSAGSVLRPSMECPPAPRKPARPPPAKRKHCDDGRSALQRCFFPVPRDLTKVFVRRGAADSSPPQAAKKVRVHPVG